MEFKLLSLEGIAEAAKQVIDFADGRKVLLFEGQMGAGKTTLIRAICDQLGVVDETSSPTFSLVNVYENQQGEELYHFDFYRIKDEDEAFDIGADEYFYSGKYCFIEWGEKIPRLIPDENVKISINLEADNTRTISLSNDD